jgi:hypothetical protein
VNGHENLCRDCFKKRGIKIIEDPNEAIASFQSMLREKWNAGKHEEVATEIARFQDACRKVLRE